MGPWRVAWENLQDLCYIIQDTKAFQFLTLALIVLNALVLAVIW
jgi:hypothetical protein